MPPVAPLRGSNRWRSRYCYFEIREGGGRMARGPRANGDGLGRTLRGGRSDRRSRPRRSRSGKKGTGNSRAWLCTSEPLGMWVPLYQCSLARWFLSVASPELSAGIERCRFPAPAWRKRLERRDGSCAWAWGAWGREPSRGLSDHEAAWISCWSWRGDSLRWGRDLIIRSNLVTRRSLIYCMLGSSVGGLLCALRWLAGG